MSTCHKCGEEYSDARADLGYRTCLDCGESNAVAESQRRAKCTAPAYNKGPYMYVYTVDQVKDCHRKGG
jgi:predicted  nucleic acid-binding Zn-ribbon protein